MNTLQYTEESTLEALKLHVQLLKIFLHNEIASPYRIENRIHFRHHKIKQ